MSTRSQVKIQDGTEVVYLYQHCDGNLLGQEVADSLNTDRGKSRSGDFEYLGRIVLEDMIVSFGDHGLGQEYHFGIGVSQHSDIEYLVTLDTGAETFTEKNLYTGETNVYTFNEIWQGAYKPIGS